MSKLWWTFLAVFYLIIAAIIYSPSLKGPWQYDDLAQILDQKVLTGRSMGMLLGSVVRFTAWPDGWTGTRDVVRATFLANWQWWGNNPAGYRWVNLGIHVANALLVACLIYNLYNGYKGYNRYIPAFAGLLFLVHPINSQAVAYIAQRYASLTTLFYLGALILYILYSRYNSYKSYTCYILSLVSALLAYTSKEISVTLPIVLLLITYNFYNGYKHYKSYKRYIFLIPFFLFALKIPFQITSSSAMGVSNIGKDRTTLAQSLSLRQLPKEEISRSDYFLTQLNVVRTYERLLVWPVGQTIDWDYPITNQFDTKTGLSLMLHLGLLGGGGALMFLGGIRSIKHTSLIGLGILWFYVTLAVESSIIPIPDVLYEHRVYLPFVGVCIAVAGAAAWASYNFYNVYKIYKNYILAAAAIWLLLLSSATMRRAWVWGDDLRLWADAAEKSPNKPRTNKNYGVMLASKGKYAEGIKYLQKAVNMEPENADYWGNFGTAYLRAGLYDDASGKFLKAFELSQIGSDEDKKKSAQYMNDYGVSMVQLGRAKEALDAFEKSLELRPDSYSAQLGLGAAKNVAGDTEGATKMFLFLVATYPNEPDAYNNLAVMLGKAGRYKEAIQALQALKKLQPNNAEADRKISVFTKQMTGKP